MKVTPWLTVCMLLLSQNMKAQELFPLNEPASSTPPKHALGIRMFDESWNEIDRLRNLIGLKAMYGVTSNLTVMVTGTVSNHHNKELPPQFPEHNTPQLKVYHPYLFNGLYGYAKYRFLSIDGEHTHFRMAAYGEYSTVKAAHDEAEPELLDDNAGFGGGLISTYLKNHFAVSFTGGIVVPSVYHGTVPDEIPGLPGVAAQVQYGKAYIYNLSIGYLLFPHKYKSYDQTNWNIYLELLGKTYNAVNIEVGNVNYAGPLYSIRIQNNKVLQAGNYIEAHPGVQCIVRSNLRMDFSMGFPVVNRSWVHYYPVFNLGIQRYFYFNKRKIR